MIEPVRARTEDGFHSVEADVTMKGATHRIYFRSCDAPLLPNIEAFATLALLPCMATGCDCVVNRPVSARWLAGVKRIQKVLLSWEPRFSCVRLIGASPRPWPPRASPRVAAFFSGGVDSFYTLLKHQQEITDLVFVHGFDIALDNVPVRRCVSAMLRRAADALGKRLIEVETNLRSLTDPYVGWGWAHGASLAAAALMLSQSFNRIYVPSSYALGDAHPWGSHHKLDPNWGTETLELVHDGSEATRVEKVAFIAQSDIALRSLRVCWKNTDASYNCGRCEKCVRTMINLYAVGALERCSTFRGGLKIRRVYRVKSQSTGVRVFAKENLAALKARDLNPRLRLALHRLASGKGTGNKWTGTLYWLLDGVRWLISGGR